MCLRFMVYHVYVDLVVDVGVIVRLTKAQARNIHALQKQKKKKTLLKKVL